MLLVDLEPAHDLLEQPLGVIGVVDREVASESQQLAVETQHAHAHRVKRHDPHRAHARVDEPAHALAHLCGGLVGERDREDLGRIDAQVFD